ncbi:MAG: hypothetical protein ND895_00180, partial [Pyrinomonadaceae bacterium]|nr:hypothetical protein [Pyrinomonadaceae bacterium]
MIKHYKLGFLGFGNVGRALARLLVAKSAELRDLYELEWSITGVATRGLGWLSKPEGFQTSSLLSNSNDESSPDRSVGINEWLLAARPDVIFETTSLNHETGQPAIDYLTAVLKSGSHAVTANKGAVVFGYDDLSKLAADAGKRFFLESTVLDSAPVFSLFRETLPAVKLRAFSGVFNSTSNVIIETMEA